MFRQLNSILSKALDDNNDMKKKYITKNDVINALNTNYSSAFYWYNKGIIFYRAEKTFSHPFFIAKSGIRISQETDNIYGLLISDIIPSWECAQKRSKSIIMSTNQSTASYYLNKHDDRNMYVIFPLNKATLTVCPKNDIWISFTHPDKSIDCNFNILVFQENLLKALTSVFMYNNIKNKLKNNNMTIEDYIPDNTENKDIEDIEKKILLAFNSNRSDDVKEIFYSYDMIVNSLSSEDKRTIYAKYKIDLYPFAQYFIKNITDKIGIISLIDNVLNFGRNGFENVNISSMDLNSLINEFSNVELWTESPCLFAKMSDFNKLIENKKYNLTGEKIL